MKTLLAMLLLCSAAEAATVVGVVSGNTLRMADGSRVTLRVDDRGKEAAVHLRWWLLDRPVKLTNVIDHGFGRYTADVSWRGVDIQQQIRKKFPKLTPPPVQWSEPMYVPRPVYRYYRQPQCVNGQCPQ